ncbi:MAG: 2-C-methyl-D-erythritol 2,4-cyclodiphosphate synthase, partial [Candidatus Cloacimonadaceae bacterium]|nr:2-C-methyl-D-erythritol 2,4-cyclodiphosphate synthase [Candidatus Cloacimonadaceae bacterium]
GYDVHRLVPERKLILGGVHIPYDKGLLGHSDADVLIHAVIDALLGALALGDIGRHFPDTDPQYKDMDSRILLHKTYIFINEIGYRINNLDVTVCAKEPKLSEYIDLMRHNLANSLFTDFLNISIKATTEEGMGVSGSGDAISATCVVTLIKK